jgi:hypothetical protein
LHAPDVSIQPASLAPDGEGSPAAAYRRIQTLERSGRHGPER